MPTLNGQDAGPTFPDLSALAETVRSTELDDNFTVGDLINKIFAQPERYEPFADVEALGMEAYEQPGSVANELAGELTKIRNVLADELRTLEMMVGVEVLDDLLFHAIKEERDLEPVLAVLTALKDARVDASGLAVFGMHSLGLLAPDFSVLYKRDGLELISSQWGMAVMPQTNDLGKTIDFLDRVREAFGVEGDLPAESVRHWHRSRAAQWLERNPMVVVRVAEAAGSYYENEHLLLARLQSATVLLSMLAAMQPNEDDFARSTLSTAVVNNTQTLDIHHYMVLSSGRGTDRELGGNFVPIHGSRADLVEMSELRMDLDAGYWEKNPVEADQIQQAVAAVYRGYLRRGIDRTKTDAEARQSRRLFESLVFFQRSFSGQPWRDVVSLSTAFESLLHDPSAGNTSKRIAKVIGGLFSKPEGKQHSEAFRRVYQARNDILHNGLLGRHVDLVGARRAYVSAFARHIEAEGLLRRASDETQTAVAGA